MNLLKKNFKKVIYCFCIGFIVNIIPITLNNLENRKNSRIEFLEKKILEQQKEKVCKEKSEYSKFFEMGFEATAQKRLISCMNKSNPMQ